MNKIASFTVNHLDLLTGVYVSRKDYIGDVCLTTFDLRFTRPNEEPPMDTPGIHSIEHLVATFLRNHAEWAEILFLYMNSIALMFSPTFALVTNSMPSSFIISSFLSIICFSSFILGMPYLKSPPIRSALSYTVTLCPL